LLDAAAQPLREAAGQAFSFRLPVEMLEQRPPRRGEPAGAPTPAQPVSGTLSSGRLRSAELFGTRQEIEIEHGEAVYRLRITSQGKLILTK
jgi:hemin uptake protein HemP